MHRSILLVASLLLLGGCHSARPPAFVQTAPKADHVEVRPGVPRGEPAPDAVVRLHGEIFYDRFLDLGDADKKAIAAIVADDATYAAHVEGKKCGGFHADYVVQWKSDGAPYQVLFCFGCHETLSLGDGEERVNDLSDAGYAKLAPIFDRAKQ
jgi:hypothetical protein